MAANPERHPLDDEIEAILENNPGLREELADFDRRYDSGEAEGEVIADDEVRQDLIERASSWTTTTGLPRSEAPLATASQG